VKVSIRLYQLDLRATVRSDQGAISRNERSIQRFSKGKISGVVSRQIVPHLPDTCEQSEMRIAGERKVEKITESFGAPASGDAC
jgi:hypothetical protein